MLGFLLSTKRTIAVSPKGKNQHTKKRHVTPLTNGVKYPLKMAENKWVTGVVITPFFGVIYIYMPLLTTVFWGHLSRITRKQHGLPPALPTHSRKLSKANLCTRTSHPKHFRSSHPGKRIQKKNTKKIRSFCCLL